MDIENEPFINTQPMNQMNQSIQVNQSIQNNQINQINQNNQLNSQQITISQSDFSVDEILKLLEEEELRNRKRTYEDTLTPLEQKFEPIGFVTANEYKQFQNEQDEQKYSQIQQKRSLENESN